MPGLKENLPEPSDMADVSCLSSPRKSSRDQEGISPMLLSRPLIAED